MTLLAPRMNFGEVPADYYVFHFMRFTLKHVNTKWRSAASSELTLEDMVSLAAEVLATSAAGFPEWAIAHNVSPYDGAVFWSTTRTMIDFKLVSAVAKARKDIAARTLYAPGIVEDGDEPLFDGDPWTQLRNFRPPSVLLEQLVVELQHLSDRYLVALCLYHFDELTWDQVAEIMDMSIVTLKRHMSTAIAEFRDRALALTLDEFGEPEHARSTTDFEPSQSLRRWIFKHYGTTPSNYVAYVLIHFRADVSYVVDMLDFATGNRVVHRAHQRSDKGICRLDGCTRHADATGLCKTHYNNRPEAPRCTLEGCDQARSAWGLCPKHYQQEKRRRAVAEILR